MDEGNGDIIGGQIEECVRIRPNSNRTQLEIFDRGSGFSPCSSAPQWHLFRNTSAPGFFFAVQTRAVILTTTSTKNITIFGNSRNKLYEGTFANCRYSVECIKGCPPNSLDCGDCCLDCNSIFNQISEIRALLSRLKT
jgi:hypothetical protein